MWEKLKKLLKTTNDKAIIVEDGEPRYVILSVDEYSRLSGADNQQVSSQDNVLGSNPYAYGGNVPQQETSNPTDTIDLSDINLSDIKTSDDFENDDPEVREASSGGVDIEDLQY